MQVSQGIAITVYMDYEDLLGQGLEKSTAVRNLAKQWSLTLSEVLEIINNYEADEAEDNLGEIV